MRLLQCNSAKRVIVKPFKCQPHKMVKPWNYMVKHTETIRRHKQMNCLSVFDDFVKLVLKELKKRL